MTSTNNTNSPQNETVRGTVKSILFRASDSPFTIFKIVTENNSEIVVHGSSNVLQEGESAECTGSWFVHQSHGRQFRARTLHLEPPTKGTGIQKFLESKSFKGIGKHYAKKLHDVFGDKLIWVIENDPGQLKFVKGFGPIKQKSLVTAWKEYQTNHALEAKIDIFLLEHGLGHSRAQMIRAKYGEQTIEIMREDPYRLCRDFFGIGFSTADKIALSVGIKLSSPQRIRAGIDEVLTKRGQNLGHCATQLTDLITETAKQLGVDRSEVHSIILSGARNRQLVIEDTSLGTLVYLPRVQQAEIGVAKHLKRLMSGTPAWGNVNVNDIAKEIEISTGLSLSPSQKVAITTILANKVSILTGGPGVGKTQTQASLIAALQKFGLRILLAAPTGKAAERMTEATGLPAATIHRLLEFNGHSKRFSRNQDNPLDVDMVIVDELSMIDLPLYHAFLRAIPDHSGLLHVGDADQLPSVGLGAVLQDLLKSNVIPVARLTEIFRQSSGSAIVLAAHQVNAGRVPLEYVNRHDSDFRILLADDQDGIYDQLLEFIYIQLPKEGFTQSDLQVLTSMHRGLVGTQNLNKVLQSRSNPRFEEGIVVRGMHFAPGDKVIQTRNCYIKCVFNGTIGIVESVDENRHSAMIQFDRRLIKYEAKDLSEIELAYASTVHRAQGSEFPVAVLPIAPAHYAVADRRLVFTGMTRGRKLSVIISTKRTLYSVVKNVNSSERVTYLAARLRTAIGGSASGA